MFLRTFKAVSRPEVAPEGRSFWVWSPVMMTLEPKPILVKNILDEAQNTTPAQMKMFLTRIGFGSKVVITGDSTQKDLPSGTISGLDVAVKVVKDLEGINICTLTSKDVVRHPLVQKIVKAYEDYEKKSSRPRENRRKKG